MSSRRTLILVGAIVIGALSAFLIVNYVGNVKEDAKNQGQPVQTVVASGDIPAGTTANDAIDRGLLKIDTRARRDLPATAITRLEDIKGQTAAITVSDKQVITAAMFTAGGSQSNSHSGALDPNMVAITVSVDTTHSVGGLVGPGDYVNIMVDKIASSTTTGPVTSETPSADTKMMGADYVYQKARVLAIGTNLGAAVAAPADGSAPAPAPAASDQVTFEVPPEAAQVLATAAQATIRLVLVRPDYQPHPIPPYVYTPGQSNFPGASGGTPYQAVPATEAPSLGSGN